jgi:membrane-bound lytic murein transglycosylase B
VKRVVGLAFVLFGCAGGGSVDADAPSSITTAVVAAVTAATVPATTTVPETTTTTVPGVSAVLAGTPEGLAAQVAMAEHTIRDPAADAGAVEEAGRIQQLAYRRVNARRDWIDAMRAVLPDDVRAAFDLNTQARAPIAGAPVPPPPPATIPAWTIRDPKPVDDLLGFYRDAEQATGVPWYYLAAINLAETAMGRIDGVSSAGAQGPMQFLPSTWASCCTGDIVDDHDAIMGAAQYLARSGAPARMDDAILRYNPSRAYLQAVTSYAEVMRLDERAYRGYHAWQVFVTTSVGSIRLPVGFTAAEPIDAATYLAAHPADRA